MQVTRGGCAPVAGLLGSGRGGRVTGSWRAVAALLLLGHGAALPAAVADDAPHAAGAVAGVSLVGAASVRSPITAGNDTPFDWHLPRGFPTPAVPPDNPMSVAKVALGRRLFFETRLSVTGQYSCASCHAPALAYTDGRALAVGATGEVLSHSAMSLVNVAYNISFGWTRPELQSLEGQMLEPLLNEHPVELGVAGRQAAVCALLVAEPAYREAFALAFPPGAEGHAAGRAADAAAGANAAVAGAAADDGGAHASVAVADACGDVAAEVSFGNIVKAIAAFERTLISGDSPFDRYVFGGDHEAISAQAKSGMQLFYSQRAGCGGCHSGFNFNGNWRDNHGDTGKPAFANNGVGDQLMRVPTLRNIAVTAPYMHDGRFATLDAVFDHYARAAKLSANDPKLRTFNLSADERADVIAFLHTLTDAEFSGR